VSVLQAKQLRDHFLIPGTDRTCFYLQYAYQLWGQCIWSTSYDNITESLFYCWSEHNSLMA